MAHAAPRPIGFKDCRDACVTALEALAAEDSRIVAVVNDSVGSSKLNSFQKKYPDRMITVGIAEQSMVGVGAGLANGGQIPFVSGASCFLTSRALEQVKADIVYAGFNVKLVTQSPDVGYGELGPTHHSIEDVAWLRPLNTLTVIAPSDAWETPEALKWAAVHDGPVYLRLIRTPVPDLDVPNRVVRAGKAELMRQGHDVTIIACGTTVHQAAAAADKLAGEGIPARVLNMATINPPDDAAVLLAASETGAIITVEEASIRGGLGGAVAELTSANTPVPVERVGFAGFVPTASVAWLSNEFGLTAGGIAAAAQRAIGRKRR